MCNQILKCYLINENNTNFPHDPFNEGIFCTCVCICSLHISVKMLSFEMLFFIRLSVLACFPTFIKTYPGKKRTFYSVLDL